MSVNDLSATEDPRATPGACARRVEASPDPVAHEELRGLLAACRERLDVSQEKLAELVGVSGRHYGNFERGRVPRPSPVLLERVAATLQMSCAEKQSMYALACSPAAV